MKELGRAQRLNDIALTFAICLSGMMNCYGKWLMLVVMAGSLLEFEENDICRVAILTGEMFRTKLQITIIFFCLSDMVWRHLDVFR
jgi:hypothetical protein